MKHNINSEIAFTHIFTRKKQSFVAAAGVMVGISIFIFMNSLMKGFDRYSEETLFKTVPHLRIYKENQLSTSLLKDGFDSTTPVIVNPRITKESTAIVDPEKIMDVLRKQTDVVSVAPEVTTSAIYSNGGAQLNGTSSGISVPDEDKMFNLKSNMVAGTIEELQNTPNGIILGVGIAKKLNIQPGENITITSAKGVTKVMKIVGLFKSGMSITDKTKSYINIATARQLLKQGPGYVTDLYLNFKDASKAKYQVQKYARLTGYQVEDWESANESAMAANRVRRTMALAISMSILLVAGFGIYNILNMTIMQKMNDIAILKAMGFKGKDVVRIFVQQAVMIGVLGVGMGMVMATVLVNVLAHVWVGGDIGYFPIRMEPMYFGLGIGIGLVVTFMAGFIPARKAAKVDPVSIFRK